MLSDVDGCPFFSFWNLDGAVAQDCHGDHHTTRQWHQHQGDDNNHLAPPPWHTVSATLNDDEKSWRRVCVSFFVSFFSFLFYYTNLNFYLQLHSFMSTAIGTGTTTTMSQWRRMTKGGLSRALRYGLFLFSLLLYILCVDNTGGDYHHCHATTTHATSTRMMTGALQTCLEPQQCW